MSAPLTQEDPLILLHEEYIQRVTESGQPLWLMDLYNSPNTQPHEPETQHKPNPDQSQEIPDLPF